MPIGDILASITGEQPGSATPNVTTTATTGVKRKVTLSSDSNGAPNKMVKQSHSAPQNPIQRRPSPSSSRHTPVAAKPTSSASNGQRPVAASSLTPNGKPYTGTATFGRSVVKPLGTSGSSLRRDIPEPSSRPKLNSTTLSAPRAPLVHSGATTPTSSGPAKTLKRGSMAEIMARAAKAQQIAPKAGLIQHKPVGETVMSRKEREERRRKPGSLNSKKSAARGSVPTNARAPGEKPSASRLAQSKTDGKARPASSGSDMAEKKFPKAAAATTGYRGTARPPPQKAGSRNGHAGSSHGRASGGMLDPPKYSRRYRDEDEDPELDDFIDYDDEEEPVRNFDYNSDGSSDMEAGMDDIYREETRAERQAREEDRREEEMLARLRREKEERKKRTGS